MRKQTATEKITFEQVVNIKDTNFLKHFYQFIKLFECLKLKPNSNVWKNLNFCHKTTNFMSTMPENRKPQLLT